MLEPAADSFHHHRSCRTATMTIDALRRRRRRHRCYILPIIPQVLAAAVSGAAGRRLWVLEGRSYRVDQWAADQWVDLISNTARHMVVHINHINDV